MIPATITRLAASTGEPKKQYHLSVNACTDMLYKLQIIKRIPYIFVMCMSSITTYFTTSLY